jgi:hypothetical protein
MSNSQTITESWSDGLKAGLINTPELSLGAFQMGMQMKLKEGELQMKVL